MNIVLCGPPRSGKTTLGKVLAKRLQWTFYDTDELLNNHYECCYGAKLSNREIYQACGEELFRELEYEILQSLYGIENCIVALGGGTVCQSQSREYLKTFGDIIYLKTPLEVLVNRMQATSIMVSLDTRHLKSSLEDLLTKRAPLYEEIAQYTCELHLQTPGEAVNTLYQLIINGGYGQ